MKSKLAYVAGPYSARTIFGKLRNIYRAWRAARMLWRKGYTVICPHMNSALMDSAISNDEFIKRDLQFVEMVDIVFLLPDWFKSEGARTEVNHARKLRKKVVVLDRKAARGAWEGIVW